LRRLHIAQPWCDELKDTANVFWPFTHPLEVIRFAMAFDTPAKDRLEPDEHVSGHVRRAVLRRRRTYAVSERSVLSRVLALISEVPFGIQKASCPREFGA
jgi:hypothetical protein